MLSRDGWDLIVVGGGLAGLTTGLRAAELGLKAVVLEKGQDERYPCNSRFSGGIIHVSYHDVKRSYSELMEIMRKATENQVPEELADAVATDAGRFLDWLQSHGVRFMRFSNLESQRWCMSPARPVSPGLDWKGRGPDVTLRLLTERLEARGGALARGTAAKSLRMEGGRCVGVLARTEAGEEAWSARAVVIADGGFQANPELFRRFIGQGFEQVFQRGAATGCGDGLTMAAEVGAKITPSQNFYGHVLSREAFSNDSLWPWPELDAVVTAGIVVGPDGRRLLDEGLGGIALANTLARLPEPASCFVVFDAAIWDGPGKTARIPANPMLERAGGTIRRADSVEALAREIGVPPDALAETVRDYNAAVRGGTADALPQPRTTDTIKAWPIEARPLMAIAICPGITHTMGGIAVDGQAQVVGEDGSPIPGLFAAGAAAGGLEGGGRLGYVGGLVKAGVFGLRAAERAAALRAA